MRSFRTMPRFQTRHAAGAKAVPVWVCRGCETHNKQRWDKLKEKLLPPKACIACGRMDFDHFSSTAEANGWAELRLQQKAGIITNLRRQVRYPLYAFRDGHPVKVADYVADYDYDKDGAHIIVDRKPAAGIDDLAKLKLKWMECQGTPVHITTT